VVYSFHFTSFVKFILEAIINGIVFLYSFSVCSWLVYTKASDFCELILCPSTFLKVEFFLAEFSGLRSCDLQIG
jgi:hypothetical protein